MDITPCAARPAWSKWRAPALGVLAVLVWSQNAHGQDEDRWRFFFTPYLILASLNGDAAVGGQESELDESFSDIFENLDFGAMGTFEARRGRFGVSTDLQYSDLGVEGDVPLPGGSEAGFEFDSSTLLISPAILFRLTRPGPLWLDALAGFRFWSVDNSITLRTSRTDIEREFSDTQGWLDPIVGARVIADLSERWFVLARGDIGGFGMGADFTWQALGGLGYRFDDAGRYSAILAWRQIDVDYEDEDDGFLWDVTMGGPTVGFSFAW